MSVKFNAIKRVLEKGLRSTTYNQTWAKICHEYEIGRVEGKSVHFTISELQHLRRVVNDEFGIDPQGGEISGDRIALAHSSLNEKLSKQSVFGSLIQAARLNMQPISLKGNDHKLYTPEGIVSCIPPEQFTFEGVDSVIVLENGTVMVHWAKFNYPVELTGALITYRGHGDNLPLLNNLLLESNITKYAFFDCDPSGVLMAVKGGFDYLLVPSALMLPMEAPHLIPFNNEVKFHEQRDSLEGLHNEFSRNASLYTESLRDVVNSLTDKSVAIMQEHILAKGLSLTVVKIRN